MEEYGPNGGNTGSSKTADIMPNAVLSVGVSTCGIGFPVFVLLSPGALKANRKSSGMSISTSVVRQDLAAMRRRFHNRSDI